MIVNDNQKPSKSSRRTFIKNAGATGIIFTGSAGIGAAAPSTTEIPIAKSRDKVLLSIDVPELWWRHIENTRLAEAALRRSLGVETSARLKESDKFRTVFREPRSERIGGRNAWKLVVGVNSEARNDVDIPKSIDDLPSESRAPQVHENIPIEKRLYDDVPDLSFHCQHEDVEYNMRGGFNFGASGGNGTAACRVSIDSQTNDYMLSAAHLWDPFGPDDIHEGEDAENGGEKFGEVSSHFNSNIDYALVNKTNQSYSFNSDIVYANWWYWWSEYTVTGYAVNYEALADEGRKMQKMGQTTGGTTGTIIGVSTDKLHWDVEGFHGDSGSAVFFKYNDAIHGYSAIVTGLMTNPHWEADITNDNSCNQDMYTSLTGPRTDRINQDVNGDLQWGVNI